MKLKTWYEALYEKIFSIKFFKSFLKIPGVKKLLEYETMSYLVFGALTTAVNIVAFWGINKLADVMIRNTVTAVTDYLAGTGETALAETVLSGKIITYETLSLFYVPILHLHFKWIYLSNAIAWIVSVLFSFFTNKLFVFESPSFSAKVVWREFGTFVGSRIISFLLFEELAFGVLEALFSKMEISGAIWIAKILVAVLVVVFNYVASKLVIFRKKKPDAAAAEATEESGENA